MTSNAPRRYRRIGWAQTRPGTAVVQMSDDVYHGHYKAERPFDALGGEQRHDCKVPRSSNSSLGLFAEDPREYAAQHVLGAPPLAKSTDALWFGKLWHALVFEPMDVGGRFVFRPRTYNDCLQGLASVGFDASELRMPKALDAPPRAGSQIFDAWLEHYVDGRHVFSREDAAVASAMAKSVEQHPRARELLFASEMLREKTLLWRCPITGERMRSKLDSHTPPTTGRPLIVDLKSVREGVLASDRKLREHCYRYGYHRAAAVYSDAYQVVYGVRPEFAFVFVEKRERDPAVAVIWVEDGNPALDEGRSNFDRDDNPVGYQEIIRSLQRTRAEALIEGLSAFDLPVERVDQAYRLPEWRLQQLINDEAANPLVGVE